jgi:hypothetical protein
VKYSDGLPPLFDGPSALEPGPLWVGGRRRAVPNRAGFNPFALRLEPAQLADNAHHVNRAAHAFLIDPTNFRQRHKLHQLARRKKTGTRAEPIRRKQGRYEIGALEVRDRALKMDAAEGLFRLLAWCVWHADWRTGKVGLWRDGRIKYQDRTNIAERAGFPARVDERGRVRAYQLDDRIEDAIAAGFLFRHEEERTKRVVFKVMPLLWILLGVQQLRDQYGARARKEEVRAEAERQAKYEQEKAGRRAERKHPTAAALVAALAAEKTNDTDYHAKRPGRGRGDDPPDE